MELISTIAALSETAAAASEVTETTAAASEISELGKTALSDEPELNELAVRKTPDGLVCKPDINTIKTSSLESIKQTNIENAVEINKPDKIKLSEQDLSLKDEYGRTNAERIDQGLLPIDANGATIELHYIVQKADGTLAELTATELVDVIANYNELIHSKHFVELSDKELIKTIDDGLGRLLKGELTNIEKGNLCEMMMDQHYISQGYEPLHNRITSIEAQNHHGIDGVYEKTLPNGKKEFVIADSKYDQSPMGHGINGEKQMSKEWQDKNMENTVGAEKAAEIKEARKEGNVKSQVFHTVPIKKGVLCEVKDVSADGSFDGKGKPAAKYIYYKLLKRSKVETKNLG